MRIIGGTYRNRKLISPNGLEVRPTSERLRETLFNICQTYIEDAYFLDLFAGSGAVGFEAISRGARKVAFVEKSRESIQCIRQNAKNLEVENKITILNGDVFALLETLSIQGEPFNIIYADPPYHTENNLESSSYGQKVLEAIDNSSILANDGVFFLEESSTALSKVLQLKSLILKSERRTGRSMLHQYIKVQIPEREAYKNKEALASLERGLQDAAEGRASKLDLSMLSDDEDSF